jgi:hypothetical protein
MMSDHYKQYKVLLEHNTKWFGVKNLELSGPTGLLGWVLTLND